MNSLRHTVHVAAIRGRLRVESVGRRSSIRNFSSPNQNNITDSVVSRMKEKIASALEAEKVKVVDVNGDAQHVTIDVVSKVFEGKTSVQRQRMVYKAIWEELQEAVHAVDNMSTKTPEEASG